MGISVGIDLGTSNSVVAILDDEGPRVLSDSSGRSLQPSVVALGHGGDPVVGHTAKQQLTFAPNTTIGSAKRLIGRRFVDGESQRMRAQVGWAVIEGPNGDARIRVQGKEYTAQEIAAHVLVHMVRQAEVATGETVDSAVITVPAYFNDQQRQATRDAAEIANLECLRIINEPTAAAMAYGYGTQQSQRVVVYDLGGGTFDVSVLNIGDDVIEVVSTAGDTFLGGDDFDIAIAEHLRNAFESDGKGTIPTDHQSNVRLKHAAEQLKQDLSKSTDASIRLPGLARNAAGDPMDVDTGLNRTMARKLCMPLIQRTFVVCDDALAQAGLSAAQVDGIVLVGGMTRFPIIKEAVSQYFGEDPIDHINPDEVVAVGAAIQASQLTRLSNEPAQILLDVTPQTLGVCTVAGMMEDIIPRNTPIPTMAAKVFHTVKDNQTEVRIKIYQGDAREAAKNYLLGEFVLDGLPEGPRGHAKVRVSFSLDASGMVNVTATASETGSTKEMRVEASSNLSRGEVDALRFSASAAPEAAVEGAMALDSTEPIVAVDPTEPPEPVAFVEPIAPAAPTVPIETTAPLAPQGAGILAEDNDVDDPDDIDGADMWTAEADFEDGFSEELVLDDDGL
jgi:molecular chaperone DnaK